MSKHLLCILVLAVSSNSSVIADEAKSKPNVLFISIDDLNDWTGCLKGHPQALTPNLDRLADSGVLFTNAHAPAASCSPSRTAIFTGISPHRSGLYDNGQKLREVLPDVELMPKTFSKNGYFSAGSGKLLHYFIDADSWDDYFPEAKSENPFPKTLYPKNRPMSLPRKGEWQYVETDWGALDATDEQYGGDFLVAKWISKKLQQHHAQPFFLACGFYRPHEPWYVPKKYFEPFPLDSIQLPPGYQDDDLSDLPPEGQRRGPNRYFKHIREQKQWKKGIQGYLASIYFADTMLGHVLDALEKGPNKENTIVVLWSDHGWHLGEKQHWQKYTAWRACTRVPLIIRAPENTAGLKSGTTAGVCDQPVNLLSLFPTLMELCDLPLSKSMDGQSLVPLLKNPDAHWSHPSVTHLGQPRSFGLSTKRWRYIHYASGGEELYDIKADPFEWKNLATNAKYQVKLAELRKLAPQGFAEKKKQKPATPQTLKWNVATQANAPASIPSGETYNIEFFNNSRRPIKLFVLDQRGQPSFAAIIHGGRKHVEKTRKGVIWQVTDGSGYQRGYFRAGDGPSTAIIPPSASAPQNTN